MDHANKFLLYYDYWEIGEEDFMLYFALKYRSSNKKVFFKTDISNKYTKFLIIPVKESIFSKDGRWYPTTLLKTIFTGILTEFWSNLKFFFTVFLQQHHWLFILMEMILQLKPSFSIDDGLYYEFTKYFLSLSNRKWAWVAFECELNIWLELW